MAVRKVVDIHPYVEVPDIDDMDDDIFLKHLDKRHSHETGVERSLADYPHRMEAWISVYRAFHERQHRVNDHDHIHSEE